MAKIIDYGNEIIVANQFGRVMVFAGTEALQFRQVASNFVHGFDPTLRICDLEKRRQDIVEGIRRRKIWWHSEAGENGRGNRRGRRR